MLLYHVQTKSCHVMKKFEGYCNTAITLKIFFLIISYGTYKFL